MLENLDSFIEKIIDFDSLKSSDKIDLFAYFITIEHKNADFQPIQILEAFKYLKILPYSNISQYLKSNSNAARPKKKKIKFIKTKSGFHLEANFEKELKKSIKDIEVPLISYSVNSESLLWKSSDIPFLNSKMRKNAEFFSKMYYLLYHLENSLRNFLKLRLISIIGSNWEKELLKNVELTKAQSIRKDVSLSEMLPDRGDNILYYCMWDDYGKIIRSYPNIFIRQKEADEVLAHLNSLGKVRNAIAHNTVTIPADYQDELTIFIKKYIKIMKHNDN